MNACSSGNWTAGGFSLVEMMVAMVIGLITVAAVTQSYLSSERQRRILTADSDTISGGTVALYMIEREARTAGFGMPLPAALGCTVNASYGGSLTDPGTFTFAPVVIDQDYTTASNGVGLDRLSILYGTYGGMSLPVYLNGPFANAPGAFSELNLSVSYFFESNHLAILYEPGKTCTLLQVTFRPPAGNLVERGVSPWNQSNAIFPVGGYKAQSATIFNMGSLGLKRFFVNPADSTLRVTEVGEGIAGGSSATKIVASGVVGFKSKYGYDQGGGVVTWSATAPANTAAWMQIVAVRMALVIRSQFANKPAQAGGGCTTTVTNPAWSDGEALSISDPLPSCYRYQVYETDVPLRNRMWGFPST